MAIVTLQLLKNPLILLDGTPVSLPFKKAEALLFYLAVKKTITREQASTLLWDENNDQTARKNLRHTLYTIKKCFGMDVIIFPQKQTLALNPLVTFDIDYDKLTSGNVASLYEGELLSGFSVKNADMFEEWLAKERAALYDSYMRALYQQIQETAREDVSSVEYLFSRYIKEDPLDERVYLIMMQCYQKNRLYHKGIKVYQNLSRLLNSELHISPSQEISRLHRELLNAWTNSAAPEPDSEDSGMIGRAGEMQILSKVYHAFLSGVPAAVCLTGDNGVGKTYLMNRFLDNIKNDSCLIFRATCFQAEKDFLFQPWNSIMLQLDQYMTAKNITVPAGYLPNIVNMFPLFGNQADAAPESVDVMTTYNYRATRNGVMKLFCRIGEETPVILSFDNIHYMDTMSLELLSLMIREQNPNIMVIGTCSEILPARVQNQLKPLIREKFLTQLILQPFNREDVRQILVSRLGEDAVDSQLLDNIYQETEGNAFFLDMVINFYSPENAGKGMFFPRPQDILSDRISELPRDARQVLDAISICHNYSTLDILEYVLNRDTLEIIDLIDTLKQQGLIEEKAAGQQIRFRHNNMQNFVYSQLSPSKRRLLHARIGAWLEDHSPLHDNSWYQNLIFHYSLSGNDARALKYKILYLEDYSRFNYELYPILQPQMDSELSVPKQITEYFDELTAQLIRLYHYQPNAVDFTELEARLYLVISKYYISQGEYEKGVTAIRQVLESNSYIAGHPEIHISYLRQMTFYGIQTWNTNLMKEHIKKGMEIAAENRLPTEYAIECRLYGLYSSMCGDYENSRILLNDAIKRFQSTPLKGVSFGLNIAACYNYLGEAERKQGNFLKALDFYNQAIQICYDRKCPQNPTFYAHKCRSLLALGRTREAYDVMALANKLYDDSSIMVGRAIIKAYYSILKACRGRLRQAESLYRDAEQVARTLQSPMSLGILSQAEEFLLTHFPETFSPVIAKSPQECREAAERYLKDLPGAYELHTPVYSFFSAAFHTRI